MFEVHPYNLYKLTTASNDLCCACTEHTHTHTHSGCISFSQLFHMWYMPLIETYLPQNCMLDDCAFIKSSSI